MHNPKNRSEQETPIYRRTHLSTRHQVNRARQAQQHWQRNPSSDEQADSEPKWCPQQREPTLRLHHQDK